MHRDQAVHFLLQQGIGQDEANTFLEQVEIKLNDQRVVLYRIIIERRLVRRRVVAGLQ